MSGLWSWLDSTAVALLNVRRPQHTPVARVPRTRAGEFVIGTSLAFGAEAPEVGTEVSVPVTSFAKHAGFFGGTGCGKSTMTRRLRKALIDAGVTCFDIDYRGDAFDIAVAELVASGFPAERLTLIDLRDREHLTPLNFLGFGPGDPHCRASIVYNALRAQSESWGVQLGPDLRGCLVALAEVKGSLVDVAGVLSPQGSAIRRSLLDRVADEYAREFLESYIALPADMQRVRASAVVNKLDEHLNHPELRKALSAQGAPDMVEIVNTPGHVTLVALGADRNPQAALVGRMLVSAVQQAAFSRVDTHEGDRTLTHLIVDEAQNLLDEDACQTLAEGRRFRLGLTVCAQFAGQLPQVLRTAVKVNCATQCYFHTSASEAADITGEVVSSLSRDEIRKRLLRAPVGNAVVLRRGEPAAFVSTPDSPIPEVNRTECENLKAQVRSRSTILPRPARAVSQGAHAPLQATAEEVVSHERTPFTRRRSS